MLLYSRNESLRERKTKYDCAGYGKTREKESHTTRVRDEFVGTQKVLLRRARTRITVENADVLSFLELMNDLTSDVIDDEKKAIITRFISDRKITRKDISTYAPVFPDNAMRTLIESEVIYSVTQ